MVSKLKGLISRMVPT